MAYPTVEAAPGLQQTGWNLARGVSAARAYDDARHAYRSPPDASQAGDDDRIHGAPTLDDHRLVGGAVAEARGAVDRRVAIRPDAYSMDVSERTQGDGVTPDGHDDDRARRVEVRRDMRLASQGGRACECEGRDDLARRVPHVRAVEMPQQPR